MFDLCAELLATYKKPPENMIQQLERICNTIPERCREDVYNAVLEDVGAYAAISVKDLIEACNKIGVPYTKAHYVPAVDWQCDACGFEFKYNAAPSDDDKIDKNIHDLCPKCGFQVNWTLDARRCKELKIATPWYDRLIAQHQGEDRNVSKQAHQGPDFWSRHAAERERAKELKASADNKIAEIDRARRWDTGKD